MTAPLPIAEYDRLVGLVRAAWVRLNQAGDTPDAHRSILALHDALQGLLAADAALYGDSGLDTLVARHHHGLLRLRVAPGAVLAQLAARAAKLRLDPRDRGENVPDALLVHSAIPPIWRIVRDLRRDIRRRRPLACHLRLLRRAGRLAAVLVIAWLVFRLVWLVVPYGCGVVYYAGESFDRPRGFGADMSLVHDFGQGRPLPWMRRDHWSARGRGILRAPVSTEYAFFVQCSGGLRLWLDGELLVDNWTSAGWTRGARRARRHLDAGPHDLRFEFRDRGGAAAWRVRWTGGPVPPNTILGAPHLRKY